MMEQLECISCGAPITIPSDQPDEMVRCPYCGTSYHLPPIKRSENTRLGVLSKADFNDPNLTGWEKVNAHRITIQSGTQPQLIATFPPSDRVHFVLKTSGYLDDQDIRVKLQFLEGKSDHIHAGLCARYEDGIGGYCVQISAKGSYILGAYITPPGKEMEWKPIVPWRYHAALKAGMNVKNELRVVLKGIKLTLYLNGVLATSIKEPLYQRGQTHLVVEPGSKAKGTAAFSDLLILEA